jgi:hypothetical protein
MSILTDGRVTISETEHVAIFGIIANYRLACIDTSRFRLTIPEIAETAQGVWFYVNRISIPRDFTIPNASILLMQAMVKWADSNGYNLVEENSPYSDSKLTLKQLNQFDAMFGFKLVLPPNLMIRLCRQEKPQ